ncbi:MAG: cytochrome c-type biogenesis protein CcmH [Dehalococcoidia bacterium]|nr:cytochrome c-type biogenesis protein CcmH [Dehalococcoidia bacterium]
MIAMRDFLVAILIAASLTVISVTQAIAGGPVVPGDQEVRQIAENLVCPICNGQSVADSNSQLAQDMRVVIRKKVEAGESRDQIMGYFVDRYGEGILRAPQNSGFNQVLWWLPALGLLIGAGFSVIMARRWNANRRAFLPVESGSIGMTGEEQERYHQQLEQALRHDS